MVKKIRKLCESVGGYYGGTRMWVRVLYTWKIEFVCLAKCYKCGIRVAYIRLSVLLITLVFAIFFGLNIGF